MSLPLIMCSLSISLSLNDTIKHKRVKTPAKYSKKLVDVKQIKGNGIKY